MRRLYILSLAMVTCGVPRVEPRPPSPPPDPAHSHKVGAGYYLTAPIQGEPTPADESGKPARPKVAPEFEGPPATNDWWSSLLWQWSDPHSLPMYPHPLALRAQARGLGVGYPSEPEVTDRAYRYPYVEELLVGVAGLRAPETRVVSYSDWAVTAAWRNDGRGMTATFGHGLPFVYLRVEGEEAAVVEATVAPSVWYRQGEVVGLTVRGHHYALFAPTGSSWKHAGNRLTSELAGKGFLSIAVLPDDAPETLELFRRHAYAFVTDTRVTWSYDEGKAEVATGYHVSAELVEPGPDRVAEPLLCLYRHQWLNSDSVVTKHSYASPRGAMKLLAGSDFVTRLPFPGVVPALPVVDGIDRGELRDLVAETYSDGDWFPPGLDGKKDAYWSGKSLGKIATLVRIADQLGYAEARDQFLQALENELEDWFDGHAPNVFYYDETWRTLMAFPSSYFSGAQLNDHHFHYGYFLFAAATIAELDPDWASRERWGGFVELLLKDAANWDRSDQRFPFLRHFDVYAGHSWANGPALFEDGNNQESSSEDVNLSVAAILWGSATGNRAIRDLGVFLYANQVAAIDQYWFDVDDEVFPEGFDRLALGILWSNGGKYDTWWDKSPVYVHGINFLPFTGGSLYLGRHVSYTAKNYQALEAANHGAPLQWRDIMWMYLAFSDPRRAVDLLEKNRYFRTEFGNSRASLYHWVHTLAAAGSLDPRVTADVPTALVLSKAGVKTYVAHNPTAAAATVHFSDGATLLVPPRTTAQRRAGSAP